MKKYTSVFRRYRYYNLLFGFAHSVFALRIRITSMYAYDYYRVSRTCTYVCTAPNILFSEIEHFLTNEEIMMTYSHYAFNEMSSSSLSFSPAALILKLS